MPPEPHDLPCSSGGENRLTLAQRIDDVLHPLIMGKDRHIVLIDPPNYPNVGDSAILLGELAFLKARFPRSRISFFDHDSYSPGCEQLIEQASIILIHGGGNFGDIWPHHHDIRLSVLERFPHKRIVQLPQSVSFSTPESIALTARAIAAHGDFHLLVRDKVSKAFADTHFACDTQHSPDMAFCLTDMRRLPPTTDTFCLLRTDKEAVADHQAIVAALHATNRSVVVDDWLDEPATLTRRLDRKFADLTRRRPKLTWPIMPAMLATRRRYAQDRVTAGIALLSQGRTVVTDRLHAHIMCCLMGIPHFVFDSMDGKVSAFHAAWTHQFADAVLVTDIAQIVSPLPARTGQARP